MARLVFTPLQLNDTKLDRLQTALAASLSALDARLEAVASPSIVYAFKDHVVADESVVDYRGPAGTVTLPLAASNGTGRGRKAVILNNGSAELAISAGGRETINGLQSISLPSGDMVVAESNGVDEWSAIVPTAPSAGPHLIAASGTPLTQRPTLNFTGKLVATDNPGSDRTDVDAVIPSQFTWYRDPARWYVGADLFSAATVGYSAAEAANLIYATPVTFQKAGTITNLGFQCGNGGPERVWIALYDTDPSTPWIPRTRLYDIEKPTTGFNSAATATPNLVVAAGATIWFAQVWKVGGGGDLNIATSAMAPLFGTGWAATAGAPTTAQLAHRVAVRHAFTYAQLPSTFPGSGAPTYWRSDQASQPILLYKFTPS